jgi:hypothetical protein
MKKNIFFVILVIGIILITNAIANAGLKFPVFSGIHLRHDKPNSPLKEFRLLTDKEIISLYEQKDPQLMNILERKGSTTLEVIAYSFPEQQTCWLHCWYEVVWLRCICSKLGGGISCPPMTGCDDNPEQLSEKQ